MKEVLAFAKRVPMLLVTIVCGVIMGLLWSSQQSVAHWIVTILVAIALIDTLRGMIDDVRQGHVGVDILAVVAILSTLAVKEYWAAWAVVLMVYSGSAIEEFAQSKASSNLTALVSAAPQTAHIVKNGRNRADQFASGAAKLHESDWDTQPVEQVQLGDLLVVKPGETVPVDGKLISSSATLDLSNINGEPVPRQLFADAALMSGAVNGSTTFLMEAHPAFAGLPVPAHPGAGSLGPILARSSGPHGRPPRGSLHRSGLHHRGRRLDCVRGANPFCAGAGFGHPLPALDCSSGSLHGRFRAVSQGRCID